MNVVQKLGRIYRKAQKLGINPYAIYIDPKSFDEFVSVCIYASLYSKIPDGRIEFRFCGIRIRSL